MKAGKVAGALIKPKKNEVVSPDNHKVKERSQKNKQQ